METTFSRILFLLTSLQIILGGCYRSLETHIDLSKSVVDGTFKIALDDHDTYPPLDGSEILGFPSDSTLIIISPYDSSGSIPIDNGTHSSFSISGQLQVNQYVLQNKSYQQDSTFLIKLKAKDCVSVVDCLPEMKSYLEKGIWFVSSYYMDEVIKIKSHIPKNIHVIDSGKIIKPAKNTCQALRFNAPIQILQCMTFYNKGEMGYVMVYEKGDIKQFGFAIIQENRGVYKVLYNEHGTHYSCQFSKTEFCKIVVWKKEDNISVAYISQDFYQYKHFKVFSIKQDIEISKR